MRIQLHDRVQNLACTRIDVSLSHRPATSGTVRPLDGGIADVERVCTFWQVFDAKSIFESSLLECGIPPQCSTPYSRANRVRNRAIQVKHNRFHGFAYRSARIFFLQAPPAYQIAGERTVVRLRKILEGRAEEADARVLLADFVSRLRQREKRMMLSNAQGVRIG